MAGTKAGRSISIEWTAKDSPFRPSSDWRLCCAIALLALACSIWPRPATAQESSSDVWYEAEDLDPALTEDDRFSNLVTPRGLLSTFLQLADQHRFDEAGLGLKLDPSGPTGERYSRAALAKMLAGVIHRRVVVDWASLPDRPDGMNINLPSNHPFAGKPRRTLEIAELSADGRPITISISRYKPENGEAVWLFSSQTVSSIPNLHELFSPGWLMGHIPRALDFEVAGSVRLWEVVLLPVLAVTMIVLILSMRIVIGWSAKRIPVSFIQRASRKIKTPLAIALSALLMQEIVNASVSFSGPVNALLSPVLLLAIIFFITLAVLRTIDTTLELVTDRYVGDLDTEGDSERRHFYTNIYAVRRYVLLVAVVVTIVVFLMQLNLFDSLGMSLLASAGVATVLLGIAGQTVLGNLLASLQIAIAKPIRIGDAILYEGRWCYVEAIYYTFITLRAWDSRRVIVPVKYFISHPFENWTMTDAKTTRSFTLELDLNADPDVLRDVFEDIARDEDHLMKDEFRLVAVEGYSQATQKVTFYATADSPTEAWMMNNRLAEKMGNWVRSERPEWWPRFRLAGPGALASDGAPSRAAADTEA